MRSGILGSLPGWLEVGHGRNEGVVWRSEELGVGCCEDRMIGREDICNMKGGGGAAV